MDINKYIGKFLLKNKYCSLPGLGVFDLKKEGARPNPGNESISAPVYKISFTPVGSIDDTFASFIASAENVSISNASNNIREYCKAVKEELAKTGKYDIDFLGRFTMSNSKIVFHQSDDLDLGAEPAPLAPLLEKVKAPETPANKPDYSYPPARRQKEIPVMKIAIPVILVLLLAVAGYFGYDYYQKNKVVEEVVKPVEPTEVDTLATQVDTIAMNQVDSTSSPVTDTTAHVDTNATATAPPPAQTAPASTGTGFNVAILSYDNEASATVKANKLKGYGNNVSVVPSNGRFLVVINNASNPLNDTTKLVDSLRRFFNPKGPVFIVK